MIDGVKDRCDEVDISGVVFELSCKECEEVYIGKAEVGAGIRENEHRMHPRNGHPSYQQWLNPH